jgi:NADPH2:quinone reductase
MRAFATDGFGQPGSVRELPDPEPGEGELLVRVKAAAISQTDLSVMAGYLKDYMEHIFPLVPGIDASGVVEAVGPGVDGYREGDEIFGFEGRPVMGRGTWAERVALPIADVMHKPNSLDHHEAAVLPHCALTAAAAVEAAAVGEGGQIVLLGATGGVGSFATQLVAQAGASPIAVTRGDYADYARSLGAAEVIDYTAVDPVAAVRERCPDGIDALLDMAGVPELTSAMAGLVRSGGKVVSIVMAPDVEGLAARNIEGLLTSRYAAEHRFAEVMGRLADGKLKLPAIQTFPLDDIEAAIALQATQHVHGKLAILMS